MKIKSNKVISNNEFNLPIDHNQIDVLGVSEDCKSQSSLKNLRAPCIDKHFLDLLSIHDESSNTSEIKYLSSEAPSSYPFTVKKKSLLKSLSYSFFLHSIIITLIAICLNYFQSDSNQDITSAPNQMILDVIMIDTKSMQVLTPNKISVSQEIYSSLQTTQSNDAINTKAGTPASTVLHSENSEQSQKKTPKSDLSNNQKKTESTPSIIKNNPSFKEVTSHKFTQETPVDKPLLSSGPSKSTKTDKAQVTPNTSNDTPKSKNQQQPSIKKDHKVTELDSPHKAISQNNQTIKKNSTSSIDPIPSSAIGKKELASNETLTKNSSSNINTPNHLIQAKPLERPLPPYPAKAASLGQSGTVVVSFDVNAHGQLENIVILNSKPKKIFDDSIKRTLKKWIYEPKPSKGHLITFHFSLDGVNFN